MAYLKPDIPEDKILKLKVKIESMNGVKYAEFISKDQALMRLKKRMKRQSSLIEDLKENPLPDAFEIRTTTSSQSEDFIERLATQLESLPRIEEVEYGQKWIGRFMDIFNLMKITGYAMGGLFFMAVVFIVSNTIRLVLYSRREEVEIMRLVGASDRFIKAPFYIEGIIQGALGGIFGLLALFVIFMLISYNIELDLSFGFSTIRFLPPKILCVILLCSIFVGWLGCYVSLKQFLK